MREHSVDGGEFLPPFNEGTLTINARMEPGTSLNESERIASRTEQEILAVPEVLSVSQRTGRAELDEHAEGVNSSKIDVALAPHQTPRPGWGYAALRLIPIAHLWGFETHGRPRPEGIAAIRDRISNILGAAVNIGQPISPRLDHMMLGIRAQIAVEVFGQDLRELRTAAYDIQDWMQPIPGVVDLQIEPQVEICRSASRSTGGGLPPRPDAGRDRRADRDRLKRPRGLGDPRTRIGTSNSWSGTTPHRGCAPEIINQTVLETPSGRRIALDQVAEILDTTGPNTLNCEHV